MTTYRDIKQRIAARYDPERDGGPVTWVDNNLLELVTCLEKRIEALESENKKLDRALKILLDDRI